MSYYSKCFSFPEGIDTISFRLNSRFLKNCAWKEDRHQVVPFITIRRTVTSFRVLYYLDIQTEVINPTFSIALQVRLIFYEHLYKKGLLDFGGKNAFADWHAMLMLVKAFDCVAAFCRIDFFFDFAEEKSRILYENAPKTFKDKTCVYSPVLSNRKSRICAYHRPEYLLKQNMVSHKEINEMPYKNRLEVRFFKSPSFNYFSMENLEGNYYEVVGRYVCAIAKSLRKYLRYVMVIYDADGHPFLERILEISKKEHIPTNKNLKKTPPNTFEQIEFEADLFKQIGITI